MSVCKRSTMAVPMLALGVAALLAAGLFASAGAQTETPDWVVATVNGDMKTRMGFNWRVAASAPAGEVQIVEGLCEEAELQDDCFLSAESFPARSSSFTAGGTNFRPSPNVTTHVRKAEATGLTPGTLYSYRVGSQSGWSQTGTFTTAPEGTPDFSFLYTTDPQSNSEAQTQLVGRTAEAALEYFEGKGALPSFWVMTGDHTDWNIAPEWTWYFDYQQDVFAKVPYVPIVGNHDIPGQFYGTGYFFEYVFNTETTQFSPRTGVSQRAGNYSFVYGDALFFVLDLEGTSMNMNFNNTAYPSNLKAWMESEIQKHGETRWRVAFSHRGVRTGGTHVEVGGAIARIYGELKIDFAMHGHNHVYEVLGPVKETASGGTLVDAKYITGRTGVPTSVSKSGYVGGTYDVTEGTMYFLGNRSGFKGYGMDRYNGSPFETGRVSQPGADNDPNATSFSVVDVTNDAITVTTYTKLAGTPEVYDRFTIVKPADDKIPQPPIVINGKQDHGKEFYSVSVNGDAASVTFRYDADRVNFLVDFNLDDFVELSGGADDLLWSFTSDNPNVLTVDPIVGSGIMTIVGDGIATITIGKVNSDTHRNVSPVTVTLRVERIDTSPLPSSIVISDFGDDWYYYGQRSTTFRSDAHDINATNGWTRAGTAIGMGSAGGVMLDGTTDNSITLKTTLANGAGAHQAGASNSRHSWIYFKKAFTLPDAFDADALVDAFGTHRVDDALIIYINEIEVYRYNVGNVGNANNVRIGDAVNWNNYTGYNSDATSRAFAIDSDYNNRDTEFRSTASGTPNLRDAGSLSNLKRALRSGENTITCLVGNNSASSSDLWFDLQLEINYESAPAKPVNLVSITAPDAIIRAYGEELALPQTVDIETDDGVRKASVEWDVKGSDYDPELEIEQTFVVSGTVALPAGVTNTGDLSLEITVSVTVGEKPDEPETISVTAFGDSWYFHGRTNTEFFDDAFDMTKMDEGQWGFGATAIAAGSVPSGTGFTIATNLSSGPTGYPSTRHTWTYFKKEFELPDNFNVDDIENVFGSHRIDDALIMFINGVEVYRYNAFNNGNSAGFNSTDINVAVGDPIDWSDYAGYNSNAAERSFHINDDYSNRDTETRGQVNTLILYDAASLTNLKAALQVGTNVITCVVGNNASGSSDLWFDLKLDIQYKKPQPPVTIDIAGATIVVPTDLVYNGDPKVPVVKYDEVPLVYGTNYTIEYSRDGDNISAGLVEFTITGIGDYDGRKDGEFTIDKAPGTAVAGYAIPSDVTGIFGQKLEEVELPDGWSWSDETIVLRTLGSQGEIANFTPEDTDNYNVVMDVDVTIAVAQAAGTFVEIDAINVTYTAGLTLADVELPSDDYAWVNSDVELSAGDGQNFEAVYTDASGNYESATGDVIVNVAKAAGTFAAVDAIDVTYSATLKLSSLQLPTGYVWNVDDESLNAGDGQKFAATYTDASGNYTAAIGEVTVNVAKAVGAFVAVDAINVTFAEGLTLADVELPSDDYAWVDSDIELSAGDGQKFAAVYTDASGNYESATGDVIVNVAKAAGTFAAVDAIDVTYSATLKLSSLTLPTGYVWDAPETSLNAGDDQNFAATYTDASGNYESAAGDVTVNVAKAATDFVMPAVSAVTYSTTLTLADITLPDGYAWDAPATALSVANSGTAYAVTKAAANVNYSDATGMVAVTVNRATPSYAVPTVSQRWPTGIALSSISLPEGWTWVDETQTISASGSNVFKARFTPADIVNYHVVDDIDIEVNGFTSVASGDRVLPNGTNENAAVIVPVGVTSAEFTFGPNPVAKSAGSVTIFRTGKRVESGSLTIYDATGNAVRKINIADARRLNAASAHSGERRAVGTWDLKDAKGRTVSEGTYLLRGTVKTYDSKRERVSVIIGVR